MTLIQVPARSMSEGAACCLTTGGSIDFCILKSPSFMFTASGFFSVNLNGPLVVLWLNVPFLSETEGD